MVTTTTSGIAYDDRGSGGSTLLCLPGWCGPRTLFDPLAARLEGRCRTLSVDWRGHGDSRPAEGDFGFAELVDDAVAVVDDADVATFVPVTAAHAGWAAIELRRRLGAARVPRLVLLDWMPLGAPAPFRDALDAMMDPATTRATVDRLAEMWRAGLDLRELDAYVASMAAVDDAMWARAAGAIAGAFDTHGSPIAALAALDPPPDVLHLYAQPGDPGYLEAQREVAAAHDWFRVERLDARSHFPLFEVADDLADRIAMFVGDGAASRR